jgi:hypothetical protein
MRPRQPGDFADEVHEQEPRLDLVAVTLAVDRERDWKFHDWTSAVG